MHPIELDKEMLEASASKMEWFFKPLEIYNKKCFYINSKIRHYNTAINPVSLYGSECLSFPKNAPSLS